MPVLPVFLFGGVYVFALVAVVPHILAIDRSLQFRVGQAVAGVSPAKAVSAHIAKVLSFSVISLCMSWASAAMSG